MIKEIDKKNELTDLKIKHLKPTIRIEKDGSEKLVVNQISDTKIKGLYLTVKPNNNKLWEFKYTSPTKKNRRRTSFGNYPDVSLLKAREIGQKYRELLANNIDPIDNKKEELKLIDLNTKGKIKNAINEWLKKESLSTTETTHKSKKMIFNYVMEFFRKENIIFK